MAKSAHGCTMYQIVFSGPQGECFKSTAKMPLPRARDYCTRVPKIKPGFTAKPIRCT